MGTRAAAGLAWSVWALCAALVALGVLLYFLGPVVSPRPEFWFSKLFPYLGALWLTYPTVGALIASRRPGNPIGWILCVGGIMVIVTFGAQAYADYSLFARPVPLPATAYAVWIPESGVVLVALLVTTALLLLLFPDGRPPSKAWWVVAWAAAVGGALAVLEGATRPDPSWSYPSVENPFAIGGGTRAVLEVLGTAGWLLVLLGAVFAAVSLITRWERAGDEERRQLKWFAYGAGPVLFAFFISPWGPGVAAPALLPIAVGFAIFKHGLYDIDRIINRTLVYGSLTAIIVALYVLVVGGIGALAQTRADLAVSLIAAGLVALLVGPLRKRLQRSADRLIPTTRPAAQQEGAPGSRGLGDYAPGGMSRRTAGRLAWAIWALSVPLAALSGLLSFLSASAQGRSDSALPVLFALLLLTYPTVGALVASRRPENRIGWIFCAVGLVFGAGILASSYAEYALHASSRPLPGVQYAAWCSSWASFPTWLLTATILFLLFPDGRLPSPLVLWRPVAWAAVIGGVMSALGAAFSPEAEYFPVGNPVAIQGAPGDVFTMLGNFGGAFLTLSCLVSLATPFLRLRRARGQERQQLKWFVYASALMAASVLVVFLLPYSTQEGSLTYVVGEVAWNLSVLGFMVLPIATAIAILRYRLYDIDRIINRTLVYGILTALVVGAYALAVGVLSTLLQTGTGQGLLIPVLATGLIAVLFTPVRNRLQRSVNRLMYGERDDPYKVLSRLGRRLEATLTPEAALSAVAETVAGALKLPYAAIELERDGGFETAAEHGTPANEPLVLPLHYGSEPIGRLVLAPRAPGEPFADSDLRLLEDLARQVGIAAHAARLTSDLRRSRERLVSTREEERRRLRRDLHDGLGPQLATFTLKLDAARNLLAHEPEAAGSLLLELKGQTQETISEIRRLVYDLRPPALDELGLVSALREQAAGYGPGFSVEAPEELPPLPAAVEVAAYRIAVEAMTNTARHARARVCRVCISPSDRELELEITDDGVGLPDDHRAGVGLSSMRERAAEIGGTCEIEAALTGGTRVLARLPLEASGHKKASSGRLQEKAKDREPRLEVRTKGGWGDADVTRASVTTQKNKDLKPDA